MTVRNRHGELVETLRDDLDALVERMQSADAAAAGRALFEASPRELGEAARAAVQTRG